GLPLLLALHLAFAWGPLRPGSRLFGPVRCAFPAAGRAAWLTIDDGPSDDTAAILDLLDAHGATATFFLVGERAAARPGLVREILDCQRTLAAIAGSPPRWFRAVVGHANPFVHAPLREAGLSRLAWSARGFDAVEADPARVAARIARDLRPGAIVLLHEGAPHGRSVEIVRAVLARLAAEGYRMRAPEP